MTLCIHCYQDDDGNHSCGIGSEEHAWWPWEAAVGIGIGAFFYGITLWASMREDVEDAYDRGWARGYASGESDGYEEGFDVGNEEGYDDGYEDGLDERDDA